MKRHEEIHTSGKQGSSQSPSDREKFIFAHLLLKPLLDFIHERIFLGLDLAGCKLVIFPGFIPLRVQLLALALQFQLFLQVRRRAVRVLPFLDAILAFFSLFL